MRCQRIQPHLLAFIEGELTSRKRARVVMHVAACPACTSTLRRLRQTLHMVQAMHVPEASPVFWETFGAALQQRIRQEDAAHSSRRRFHIRDLLLWPKPVLAAVALSLLLGSSLPFLREYRGQRAAPSMVLLGGEEASLTAELDFLKHLDLLEEVDVLEQLDTSR